MARAYGKIMVTIWRDADFLCLSPEAQRLYLFLVSHGDLNPAGLMPLRLSKWAKSARGLDVDVVTSALCELEAAAFVLVDAVTEEVLIRSFIKNDEGYRTPNMRKSIDAAITGIESAPLRDVAAQQLQMVSPTHTARVAATHTATDGEQHHHHPSPTPTPTPSSSSRCELTSVPARRDDDDEESFIDQVIAHIASERLKGRRTNNPAAYKATTITNLASDRTAIRLEHHRYPTLSAAQLADHYEARPELHAGAGQ